MDRDLVARKRPSGRSLAWGARPWLCPPLTAGERTGGSELCCPQEHVISLILGDPWPRSSFPPSCHWGQTVILGACTHWAKPRGLFPAQLPWLQAGAQPPRTEP